MDCALRWMMRLFFGIVLGRGLRFAHEVEKRGSPSQAALRRFQGKRLRTHTYLGDNAQAEVWRAEQKMDFEQKKALMQNTRAMWSQEFIPIRPGQEDCAASQQQQPHLSAQALQEQSRECPGLRSLHEIQFLPDL